MPARTLATVFAVSALLLAPALAAAEPVAKWDQKRVTQYAEELVKATDALDQAFRQEPSIPSPAFERVYYEAREDVRLMNNSAKHMHAELKAGQGHKKTLSSYRRIVSLRRDAEESGRKALIPESVMAKVFEVGSALFKLAPYYTDAQGKPSEPASP